MLLVNRSNHLVTYLPLVHSFSQSDDFTSHITAEDDVIFERQRIEAIDDGEVSVVERYSMDADEDLMSSRSRNLTSASGDTVVKVPRRGLGEDESGVLRSGRHSECVR